MKPVTKQPPLPGQQTITRYFQQVQPPIQPHPQTAVQQALHTQPFTYKRADGGPLTNPGAPLTRQASTRSKGTTHDGRERNISFGSSVDDCIAKMAAKDRGEDRFEKIPPYARHLCSDN